MAADANSGKDTRARVCVCSLLAQAIWAQAGRDWCQSGAELGYRAEHEAASSMAGSRGAAPEPVLQFPMCRSVVMHRVHYFYAIVAIGSQ